MVPCLAAVGCAREVRIGNATRLLVHESGPENVKRTVKTALTITKVFLRRTRNTAILPIYCVKCIWFVLKFGFDSEDALKLHLYGSRERESKNVARSSTCRFHVELERVFRILIGSTHRT